MTRKSKSDKPLAYVLCWRADDGRIEHYAGTTTANRLVERIKEHRSGRGSERTGRMVKTGMEIACVSTFPYPVPGFEGLLTLPHVAKEACVLCKQTAPGNQERDPQADECEKSYLRPVGGAT